MATKITVDPDRLRALMDQSGLRNNRALARQVGITDSAASRLLAPAGQGPRRGISAETAHALVCGLLGGTWDHSLLTPRG